MLAVHDYLQLATLAALDNRYGAYLNRFYSALFEKNYATAQAAHGKYVADKPPNDEAAASTARGAFDAAISACAAPDASTTSVAFVTCRMDATKIFFTAGKTRDTNLFDAYADTGHAIAVEADAGKMTIAQRNSALSTVADRYDAILQQEDGDYQVKANKPLIDTYVARFDKAYADAITAYPLSLDMPAYNADAVAQAETDRKKSYDRCHAQSAELKTQRAAQNCELDADRAYALAIKQQDKALLDTYTAAEAAAAADVDAGKITIQQAGDIYGAVAKDENDKLNKEQSDYQARTDKPVVDSYVARFDKAYGDARAAHGPLNPDTPPYDTDANNAAGTALSTTQTQCEAKRIQLKTYRASEDCYLDAYRTYYAAVKAQDKELLDSFITAQQAIATDTDTGKITSAQETAALTAIAADENNKLKKQEADYQARASKPLIDAYVARFDKAYADAIVAHPPNLDTLPYDPAAVPSALADQNKMTDLCASRRATLKTQRAAEDCYLDANRAYYSAIKMQDKDLLDIYVATQQAVASDADSGKITEGQMAVTLSAIAVDESNKLGKELADYRAGVNKPAIDSYVARFQTLYRAALVAHGAPPSNIPPFDFAADKAAIAVRAKSFAACDARVSELTTQAARLECRLDANNTYLAAIKIRDTALFEVWATTLREAAIDTDGGKLSPGQWNAVSTAIDRIYNSIRNGAIVRYQMNQPLVIAHVKEFDNDYLAARKAAGPMSAGPPYDPAALQNAADAYGRATSDCRDQREALKTAVAWAACFNEADQIRAATVKLRDTVLVDKSSRIAPGGRRG